jgi:uracil phosphoribosyltransferase
MEPIVLHNVPAVAHILSKLRDRNTHGAEFKGLMQSISSLVIASALDQAPIDEVEIETPLETTRAKIIPENRVIGVPILRAGLGMIEAFRELLPRSPACLLGIKRNEKTFAPEWYYQSLPKNLNGITVIILDPMLATGGSAVAAIDLLKSLKPDKIVYCGIIGAPEGVARLSGAHPDVPIYLAGLDSHLDSNAYIRPGLGDAGDRLFGT